MQFGRFSAQVAAFGVALTVVAGVAAPSAQARTHASTAQAHANAHVIQAGMSFARHGRSHGSAARFYGGSYGAGGLQCVPFARENTGIELAGNAGTWWQNAEGVYERGARPEVGSVLNFRANGRMRMGHVAVVSNVENARTVEIDHANWGGPGAVRGGVSRNIRVVDVSERNDWSAVRVALGHTGEFGSVYPTYGFIYDRPDKGTMVANAGVAPTPLLNAAPHDLRPARDRMQMATATQEIEEVAEAEDDTQPRGSSRRAGRHGRSSVRLAHAGHAAHPAATITRVHAVPATAKPRHHRA